MGKAVSAAKSLLVGVTIGTGIMHAGRYILHTSSNVEHMYDSINYGLSLIRKKYKLKKLGAGKYTDLPNIKLFTKFHVDRYRIEGLGNLSVMTSKTPSRQISTFVITPYDSRVPLAFFDLMYTLGKRKFIFEFYDVVENRNTEEYTGIINELSAVADGFADLEDDPEIPDYPEWLESCRSVRIHKEIDIKNDARAILLFTRLLTTYLDAAKRSEMCSNQEKLAQLVLVKEYVDNMLAEGGASTEIFKNTYGIDITREFFYRVFFGCEKH